MSNRKRVENSYDCPICGPITAVEFEVHHEDGSVERESVVDYGGCKAAANATNPRSPTHVDLEICPIFKKKR